MTESRTTERPLAPSGWAGGGYAFAGVILILAGIFQTIAGIAAIAEDEFFVVTPNYVFEGDATGWGWVHLILGVVLVLAGFSLFAARTWARTVGVTLAVLSAVANFFFIPYYPFWAIVIIALDVWVIWALTRPLGRET